MQRFYVCRIYWSNNLMMNIWLLSVAFPGLVGGVTDWELIRAYQSFFLKLDGRLSFESTKWDSTAMSWLYLHVKTPADLRKKDVYSWNSNKTSYSRKEKVINIYTCHHIWAKAPQNNKMMCTFWIAKDPNHIDVEMRRLWCPALMPRLI